MAAVCSCEGAAVCVSKTESVGKAACVADLSKIESGWGGLCLQLYVSLVEGCVCGCEPGCG